MKSEPLYLKPNIKVEPLVDQWYAWSHLIPPATAARNLTERMLKIMASYIAAPQVHANAVKNPRMLGGPFIDHGGKRVDEVRALRDRIQKDRSELIALSVALKELDDMLQDIAKGQSMQALYEKVPIMLRGYVELVYDRHNHPSYRLIEPLLYQSHYYDSSRQSLALSFITDDDRPFVLSTPWLGSEDTLHLQWQFNDPRIDTLFELTSRPKPLSEVLDVVQPPAHLVPLLSSFLTPVRSKPYMPYTGRGLRWRYFGHACILIEGDGISILLDPVLSYTYESSISRYTYEDLPSSLNYILITHNHQDHILFETMLQLRHKTDTVVVPRNGAGGLEDCSLKLILQKCGFRNVIDIGEMEEISLHNGSIMSVPFLGEHCDLDIRTKTAYVVRINGKSLMFAADSCNVESKLYEHLFRVVGGIDALFIGMECDGAPLSWLYGPLLTQNIERSIDQSRRLAGSNYDQAMSMVRQLRCREAYVYAMGQEPWLNYVMSIKYTAESRPIVHSNRLIETCKELGILAERLFGEKEILVE